MGTYDKNWAFLHEVMGFPGGSDGKESACNAGDLGSIPGLGRSPGGGHGNPHQYSCLENPHEQKSLAVYSSWGQKGSAMTQRLSTYTGPIAGPVSDCPRGWKASSLLRMQGLGRSSGHSDYQKARVAVKPPMSFLEYNQSSPLQSLSGGNFLELNFVAEFSIKHSLRKLR